MTIAKEKEVGDWFTTYTGKKFYPVTPKPEDVCIEDIAHALSNVCRFGGHCRSHYSVGQHSVLVSHILAPHGKQVQFYGLMHDATEAYVGDMVRPLKQSLPDYQVVEERVWEAICEKFNIISILPPVVKWADNIALMTERRDIIHPCPDEWIIRPEDYPPMPFRVVPFPPEKSEALFLEHFERLK